ncbi:MAG: rhodanese-like domain-containing protein [Alphaproteobacteria bacterium]|nr:rhodanese-like domain-containing protein [Alphaproteobacteria bacterium]MCB9795656.1 rhodanese-like domain-containing protein [Alphaproteobacteria bacterium]
MGRIRRLAGRLLKKVSGGDASGDVPPPPPQPRYTPEPSAPAVAPAASLATIDCGAQELKERLEAGEQILVVDVRTAGEVAGGVLPGAIHIPLNELEERWEELRSADEIVCYCAAGMRSDTAATVLRQKGLINATSLVGGVGSWTGIGGRLVSLGE